MHAQCFQVRAAGSARRRLSPRYALRCIGAARSRRCVATCCRPRAR